ncbi:hypothetical protein DFAR_3290011 [Desulfarculales bacterium]
MMCLGQVNPNPALFGDTCHSYLALGAVPRAGLMKGGFIFWLEGGWPSVGEEG